MTHANVTWNVINFLTSAEFRNDDVTIAFAPFFRVGGTGVNVLPVLFMGGTVVVPEMSNPTGRSRSSSGTGSASASPAGPAPGLAATDRWASADLSTLRFVLTGGAPVPDRLVRTYAREASRWSRATACRRQAHSPCCSMRRVPSGRSARRPSPGVRRRADR